ncbi:MAG: hypothetical protein K0S09_1572 [Sphingobacteriaceae bacterium]|jgi:hypothetical protein|nr:hypothetical protein [Sphingobacteriaceae bacterium]
MQPALREIKKELGHLNQTQLAEICLRLAKYKKENKELLSYLLYNADDPLAYVDEIKSSLEPDFKDLPRGYYASTKTLRKILRTLNRHAKYTANKEAELELLIWFCKNFLAYADVRTSHKPLQNLFNRQIEKILKIIPKLHEDLQFDYQQEVDKLIQEARLSMRGFSLAK